MKHRRRRKCRHCHELFRPDARNVRHQKYCSKAPCRKASKAASQRRWLNKKENKNHFRGAANVLRVQIWRQAHPRYWRHKRSLRAPALQEDSLTQDSESNEQSDILTHLSALYLYKSLILIF